MSDDPVIYSTPFEDQEVEVFLTAVEKVIDEGREALNMSPQQFRRYRIRVGLNAVLEFQLARFFKEDVRDPYEVVNQLHGYIGPDTPDALATWLKREGDAAAALADEVIRLRAENILLKH